MSGKDFIAGYRAACRSVRKKRLARAEDESYIVDVDGRELNALVSCDYGTLEYGWEVFDDDGSWLDYDGGFSTIGDAREELFDNYPMVRKAGMGMKRFDKRSMRKRAGLDWHDDSGEFVTDSRKSTRKVRRADRGDKLQALLDEYIADYHPNAESIDAVAAFLDWLYMTGKKATRKRKAMRKRAQTMLDGMGAGMGQKKKEAAWGWDKMFGEGEKVDETLYADGLDGRRYEVHIYESSEPGTWGQANFNYSVRDADTGEFVCDRDYIMSMSALYEKLREDLDRRGIVLEAGRKATRKRIVGRKVAHVNADQLELRWTDTTMYYETRLDDGNYLCIVPDEGGWYILPMPFQKAYDLTYGNPNCDNPDVEIQSMFIDRHNDYNLFEVEDILDSFNSEYPNDRAAGRSMRKRAQAAPAGWEFSEYDGVWEKLYDGDLYGEVLEDWGYTLYQADGVDGEILSSGGSPFPYEAMQECDEEAAIWLGNGGSWIGGKRRASRKSTRKGALAGRNRRR